MWLGGISTDKGERDLAESICIEGAGLLGRIPSGRRGSAGERIGNVGEDEFGPWKKNKFIKHFCLHIFYIKANIMDCIMGCHKWDVLQNTAQLLNIAFYTKQRAKH